MKENKLPLPEDYGVLLAAVKERIRSAQYEALKAVNKELVGLYWDIGQMLVSRQSDAAHGDAIAEQLAADLRQEFPGVAGYSRRNVFYMREFFLAYRDLPKVQPLVAQIGWTHNLIILQRCADPLEREFYLAALDAQLREPGENPSIGIILCKEKRRTIVEYALRDARKPIGVAAYRIVKTLPKEFKGQLPAPEQIAKLLEAAL